MTDEKTPPPSAAFTHCVTFLVRVKVAAPDNHVAAQIAAKAVLDAMPLPLDPDVEGLGVIPIRWACRTCGGRRVEDTAWVDVNTGAVSSGDAPIDDYWCPDCDDHPHGVDEVTP